jgi:hypothetical protein
VPVAEPGSERLADVQDQQYRGPGITDKAEDNGQIDDVFQRVDVQNIAQKAGEKGSRAQGDDRKVNGNPETEAEIVVQMGHAEPVPENIVHGVQAPQLDDGQKGHPDSELGKGAAGGAFRKQVRVYRTIVVLFFHIELLPSAC